jgi:hypothetical protein
VREAREPGRLADILAASVVVEPNQRQELIQTLDVAARVERVSEAVIELLERLPSKPKPTFN